MMNGGRGMFSSPLTSIRNRCRMIHRTRRRTKRYSHGGTEGSGWTRGSGGPATSARYSGLRYRTSVDGPSGGEESMEDAVEFLRLFGLRRVAGAFDHRKPAVLDERARARRMRERKQRIVGTPDELNGDLQLVQPLGHVVMPTRERPRVDEPADGGEIRVVKSLGGVKLSEVFDVRIVDGPEHAVARARVAGRDAAHQRRRSPAERASRQPHHGLPDPRNRDHAVSDLRGSDLGATQTQRVDEHELVDETRFLERHLEGDPPAERRADQRGRPEAATLDIALDKPREVRDGVTGARLVGAAVARHVGGEHAMEGRDRLQVVPPLHVSGRTESVNEDHR